MAPSSRPILPSATQLATLETEKVRLLCELADKEGARGHRHHMLGMACGSICFLGCIAVFYLLVMGQHYTSAGVILGTSVLSIVGRMIGK